MRTRFTWENSESFFHLVWLEIWQDDDLRLTGTDLGGVENWGQEGTVVVEPHSLLGEADPTHLDPNLLETWHGDWWVDFTDISEMMWSDVKVKTD